MWNKIIFFLFYAYQFRLFFHSGEDGSVAWIALLETGVPMYYDDNWICSRKDRFPLCNGYKAARLVKCSGNNIYKEVCSINKSSLGVPIFTCSSHLYNQVDRTFCDDYSYTLSLKKSTTLANTFLKRINAITKKYWSGTKFFGIDRKDVRWIINDIQPMDSDKNNRAENSNCAEDSGGGDRVDSSDNGSMSDCPQSGASMCSINGSDMELYELENVEYNLNYNWLGVTCFGELWCLVNVYQQVNMVVTTAKTR